MSDIETRVDKAIASAVEDQLNEQREIRRLVSRVDESLVALSDGLVDLSGQISGTTDQLGGSLVTPGDLEHARAELADAIGRVDQHLAAVGDRIGDSAVLDEVRSLMSTTRIDLLESMARLERGSAPVAEAVEETRREVLRALERLGDSVDSTRDAGWLEAIERLDAVVVAFERRQVDREGAGEQALLQLRDEAEAALAGLRDAAEQRLVGSVEDLGRTVATAASDAHAQAVAQTADLARQIAEQAAREAVAAVAESARASAGELSADATSTMVEVAEAAARAAADGVAALLLDAGQRLRDDLGQTAGMLDATAVQLVQLVRGTAGEAEARLQELAASAAATVVDLTSETSARADELAALLDRLDRVTDSLDPRLQTVVTGVADSLAELLDRHQDTTAQTLEQAVAVLVRRNDEAVSQLATSVRATVDADRAQVTDALDALSQASDAVREGVMDAVTRATEQLSSTQAQGLQQLAAVTEDLQRLPEDVRTPVVALLQQLQQGVASAVEDLHAASASAGGAIEPAIRGAMDEARAAFAAVLADHHEMTERSLGEVGQAVGVAATDVGSAAGSAAEDIRRTAGEAAGELQDAAQQLTGDLRTSLEVTSTALQQAAAGAQQALADAAERLVARLEASGSDATEGLAARVDQASERVETATAQLRSELESMLASTGDRMDDVVTRIDEAARTATTSAEELRSTGENLGRLLSLTGDDVVTALGNALGEVTSGLSGVSDETRSQLECLLVATTEQVVASVTDARAALAEQISAVQETSRTDADRQHRAAAQIEQTAGGVVSEVAAIIERIEAAVAERVSRTDGEAAETVERLTSAQTDLRDQLADIVTGFKGELEMTLAGVGREVEQQTSAVSDQLARLGGVESEAAARMDAMVREATARLAVELEETRGALRESITTGSDESRVNLAAIRTEVERLLVSMAARTEELESTVAGVGARGEEHSGVVAAKLQAAAGDAVDEVTVQLRVVQQAVATQLAETEARRAEDVRRVTAVAERIERTVDALPTDVAAVVEQVRTAMLDTAHDQQRRQTSSFTEMTTTVQSLRSEVTQAVSRLSRGGGGDVVVPDTTPALRFGEIESTIAQAVERVSAAAEDRLLEVIARLDAAAERADVADQQYSAATERTEIGLADLRSGMRADADAVLDAMANRADEVLNGLSVQSEVVLSSLEQAEEALRTSLTDAFRQAQSEGLGRLDEATARLVDLGPQLETQTSVGVRDVAAEVASEVEMTLLQRVAELRGDDGRTADALRDLADQVAALAAAEDARRTRWAQPRSTPPPAPGADTAGVVTPRALGNVCEDCGFVAKTPPGLAAHRRTCASAK
ncbi:hypothetical protein BH23ACT9_BH23ACT9_27120 [soil metagenome]